MCLTAQRLHPRDGFRGRWVGHRCTIRKQGWLPAWPLLLLVSSSHIPEAVSCSEDPVGVQDAPTTDVLLVVLDADLPWPRIHRGLHPTHHTRSLQALSTVWTQWGGGGRKGSQASGEGLPPQRPVEQGPQEWYRKDGRTHPHQPIRGKNGSHRLPWDSPLVCV